MGHIHTVICAHPGGNEALAKNGQSPPAPARRAAGTCHWSCTPEKDLHFTSASKLILAPVNFPLSFGEKQLNHQEDIDFVILVQRQRRRRIRINKTGSAPTHWETEIQTMVLDHGLRPWLEPLLTVFPIKERETGWTNLGFRSEIQGSQGPGVDPILVQSESQCHTIAVAPVALHGVALHGVALHGIEHTASQQISAIFELSRRCRATPLLFGRSQVSHGNCRCHSTRRSSRNL